MRTIHAVQSSARARYLLVLVVLAVLVAAVTPADAQTPWRTLDTPNPQADAYFGRFVAVGDVNGDGKADIVVCAFLETVAGNSSQGRVYVFSGSGGTLLFTLDTPNPQANAYFGYPVAVGDVNGDGKADIAVGAPGETGVGNTTQGRAYVFSGADGSLLLTLDDPNPQTNADFGYSVAVGEVNGDGKADIAVGATGEDVDGNVDQGRAYVFSGADGSLLLTLDDPNPQTNALFGWSLAVGNVNGDGRADIAVVAPGETVAGNITQGRVYVFSGADGSLLFTLDTPNPQAQAWTDASVALGDVNGDGKGDIAVGALNETVAGNSGRAYVFSGADGSLLFTLDTPNPQPSAGFGRSVAVGDLNGDGKADIVVGAITEAVDGNNLQGRVYVFSGADGSLLFTLDTPNPQAQAWFGSSAAVGDVNGEGKSDIAIGAAGETVAGNTIQGRVYVFSPPTREPIGASEPKFVASVPGPDEISTDPEVIGTNVFLALFIILAFAFTSTLFNRTLRENRREIEGWAGQLSRPFRRLSGPVGQRYEVAAARWPLVRRLVGPAAILLLTGLIYGLLSPDFGFNTKSVVLFASMVVGVGAITYLYEGGKALITTGRFGLRAGVRVYTLALAIAVGCVLISRVVDFQPGFLYGFVASYTLLAPAALDRRQSGQVVFFPAVALLVLSVIAWLLVIPLRQVTEGSDVWWVVLPESAAVAVFVAGLQGLFFNMIPLTFFDGAKMAEWNRWVWFALFGVAGFLFWHVLLNKEGAYLGALPDKRVITALSLLAFYSGVSLTTWAYFRRRVYGSALPSLAVAGWARWPVRFLPRFPWRRRPR